MKARKDPDYTKDIGVCTVTAATIIHQAFLLVAGILELSVMCRQYTEEVSHVRFISSLC
jgi:hypothetical protein